MTARLPLLCAWTVTVLAAVVIVLGAWTRLVDAGLGCPDWPTCYGELLWPRTDTELQRAQELFPDSPVAPSKMLPELVHRYAAGLLGLCVLLLVVATRKAPPGLRYPAWLLLGVVVVQGLFGMWTVTLRLWPQVVTLHLLGGFSVLALAWWLVLRSGGVLPRYPGAPPALAPLRYGALAALLLLGLQVALGGWTSANYAALACPDFPTCRGAWWPPMDVRGGLNLGQLIGPDYSGGLLGGAERVAIHMLHRLGALLTAAYLLVLCVLLLRRGTAQQTAAVAAVRRVVGAVLLLLLLQLLLGIGNVLLGLPLALATAHNAGAAGLMLALLTLVYLLWMRPA